MVRMIASIIKVRGHCQHLVECKWAKPQTAVFLRMLCKLTTNTAAAPDQGYTQNN